MLGHLVSNVLHDGPGHASFRRPPLRLSGLLRRLRAIFFKS